MRAYFGWCRTLILGTLLLARPLPGQPASQINASPNSLTFNPPAGQTVTASITLSTSSTTPIAFTLTTSPPNSWLSVFASASQVSAASPAVLTVTANPAGVAGTQTGVIAMVPATGGPPLPIPVVLMAGSGSTYTVVPASVALAYPGGPQTQLVQVFANNSPVTAFNAQVTNCSGLNFLSLTGGAAPAPQIFNEPVAGGLSLTLNNPQSLPAGSYACQVVISNPANPSDQVTVPVSLTVTTGGVPGATPASLSFSTPPGVMPPPQAVAVTAPGGASFVATIQALAGPIFIAFPCNNCPFPGSQLLPVSVNPGGLQAGTYTNSIILLSGGSQFATVTVTLTITGGSGNGPVAAPPSLSFAYQTGAGLFPPPQTITVAPIGPFVASSNQPWLIVNPPGGTAPGNLSVSAIPFGLGVGVYQGAVNISTPSGNQTVSVTLTVTSGMVLYADPGTIYIRYIVGSLMPAQLYTLVFLASDSSFPAVNVTPQTPWINVISQTGPPGTYFVSVNPAGLCNGLNTGGITATAAGAANSPLTVPVVVLVSGGASCGAPATHFALSAPPMVIPGVPFRFSIAALDANNNVVTSYGGTVHFTSNDPAAALPADSTLSSGAGTFSATLNAPGNQTITATDTAAGSITGTSGVIAATFGGQLAVGGVSPASGSGASQTFTFTVTEPLGGQALDVVDILINNSLDARGACYLAYSRTAGVLYPVNDAGAALPTGIPLNGNGSVGNSQCSVSGPGSSVSGSGGVLTLTFAVTFSPAFGGNKVVYLAARDGQNNTGWQAVGTWGVPGAPPASLTVPGVTPARVTGLNQALTFTFNDPKGAQDLGVVNVLINDSLDGSQACYLAYSRSGNVLYLVNDAGTALLPGLVLNGSGSLSNGQCTVSGFSSSADVGGNSLTLTLGLSFRPTFAGNRVIYAAARDQGDANNSGWQAVGTWTVQ